MSKSSMFWSALGDAGGPFLAVFILALCGYHNEAWYSIVIMFAGIILLLVHTFNVYRRLRKERKSDVAIGVFFEAITVVLLCYMPFVDAYLIINHHDSTVGLIIIAVLSVIWVACLTGLLYRKKIAGIKSAQGVD